MSSKFTCLKQDKDEQILQHEHFPVTTTVAVRLDEKWGKESYHPTNISRLFLHLH